MRKPNKEERARRRAKCVQTGETRLALLRSESAAAEQVDEMRDAVLRGDCPLCGESGFKSIAGHCQTMHGVLSRELRDLLGMTYSETICSPALSSKMRELNIHKNPRENGVSYENRVYSKKGKAIRNSNIAPAPTWVSKDVLRENGKKVGLSRKGKTPWNKTSEHGTRAMYRQGCRCETCVSGYKAYNRALCLRRKQRSVEHSNDWHNRPASSGPG